jgi:hypothetical protein
MGNSGSQIGSLVAISSFTISSVDKGFLAADAGELYCHAIEIPGAV